MAYVVMNHGRTAAEPYPPWQIVTVVLVLGGLTALLIWAIFSDWY